MKRYVLALTIPIAVLFAGWVGYQSEAHADASGSDTTLAPAAPDVGSDAAAAPAAATSSPTPAAPQASDVAVVTKLYKGGSYFGLGIMALYLALFVGFKVDKKRAFYYATGLGGIAVVVDSIRRGDTPNAVTLASTLMPTLGIMIAGPNHTKAAASG